MSVGKRTKSLRNIAAGLCLVAPWCLAEEGSDIDPWEGYNRADGRRHSLSELFAPFHQTAHYCGMTYLEPFVLHESHHADDRVIDAHVTRYRARIEALRDGGG